MQIYEPVNLGTERSIELTDLKGKGSEGVEWIYLTDD
jgi:hypothetical protein